MTQVTDRGLLPAEHRALRELHAVAAQLGAHWSRLGRRLGGAPEAFLADGAATARELLGELEARVGGEFDLHGQPAAQGMGVGLGGARRVTDLLLERNQALRGALRELQHVTTLLAYAAALARARGDEALADWHQGWEGRLRGLEERGRNEVTAMAADPEAAVAPADDGPLGRAGQRVGIAMGTLGEAIDQSRVGRFARGRD